MAAILDFKSRGRLARVERATEGSQSEELSAKLFSLLIYMVGFNPPNSGRILASKRTSISLKILHLRNKFSEVAYTPRGSIVI